MKNLFGICSVLSFLFVSNVAKAEFIDQNRIVRNYDGTALKVTLIDAVKACARQGTRLPTIVELVSLNKGMTSAYNETTNNKGAVRPTQALNILSQLTQADLSYIFDDRKAIYRDYISAYLRSSIPFEIYRTSVETFYVETNNYIRPVGELGALEFWSASLDYTNPDRTFTFRGEQGDISYSGTTSKVRLAVRCY